MLEIITVCVDYWDFLELCIEQNKKFCDNYIVVTSPRDLETQKLCQRFDVECVITDVFYENGAVFNKGAAINEGLKKLKYKDNIAFIDSDTKLPNDFLQKIDINNIDITKIYGTGRRFIWTYQDYLDLESGKKNINDFIFVPGYGVGFLQILSYNNPNFQKYNPNFYPSGRNCSEIDIQFLKRISRYNQGNYEDLVKIDMDVLCLGGHGLAHNSRFLARDERFKYHFKSMPDLSNLEIYK